MQLEALSLSAGVQATSLQCTELPEGPESTPSQPDLHTLSYSIAVHTRVKSPGGGAR